MPWAPSDSWFVPFLRGGLRKAGVTVSDSGPWNPELASAVKTFQGSKGLTKDGIPGPNTWQALGPALGPMTALKAEEAVKAALTLRGWAYMTAIHAHGSPSAAAQAWSSANTVQLLTILEKFDVWMQQSGAAALLWKYSWPEDKIPPGYPTYDGGSPGIDPKKSKRRLGAVGFLPLVLAGPPMLVGAGTAGGMVATAIVKTIGAGAAVAGAAWLGVKLTQWATATADSAPTIEETSDTQTVTAPPVGASPPPPSSPKGFFSLRKSLREFVKLVGKVAAMVVAVLVGGFGVVATLTTAAGPLVVAAAGAAGGVLWLGLAALVAFILGASKRERYGNG